MATSIKITIPDRARLVGALKSVPDKIVPELRKATAAAALSIETESKKLSPVDTGRLRSSIATSLGVGQMGIGAIVKTNVFYAIYVHEGTRKMRARPFMQQAVSGLEQKIEKFYTESIDRALASL